MNENNRIYYSKVQDPTKWDVLPDPLFECKSDEDALKAQRYMNGLYSEIEKLKEALSKYADHIDGQWIPHAIEESYEWQTMESSPKDGQGILTYPHYIITYWVTSKDNNGVEGWVSDYDEDAQQYIVMKNSPKYWWPLPKPPKYHYSEDKNKDSND